MDFVNLEIIISKKYRKDKAQGGIKRHESFDGSE
jgi:hypothetical protein